MNSISLDNVLLDHANQTISGNASFDNVAANSSISVKHLINGVNLTDVAERSMTLSGDQNITGNRVFSKSAFLKVLGNLDIRDTFNGADLEQFKILAVSLDGISFIQGHLRFETNTTIVVYEMTTAVNSRIDNVNVTRILADVLISSLLYLIMETKQYATS